jgi:hypothetical protein
MITNYIVHKLNHKHMKSIIHTTTMCIIAMLSFVIPAMLCTMTQSHTVQRMHQIEFEQCIADEPSDYVCDSCYTKIMGQHTYWFNKKLYPDSTIEIE